VRVINGNGIISLVGQTFKSSRRRTRYASCIYLVIQLVTALYCNYLLYLEVGTLTWREKPKTRRHRKLDVYY